MGSYDEMKAQHTYGGMLPDNVIDTIYAQIKKKIDIGGNYDHYIRIFDELNGGKIPEKIQRLIDGKSTELLENINEVVLRKIPSKYPKYYYHIENDGKEIGHICAQIIGNVPIDPESRFSDVEIKEQGFSPDEIFHNSAFFSGGFGIKPDEQKKGYGRAAIKQFFIDHPKLQNIFLYAVPWQRAIPFWYKLGGKSILKEPKDKTTHFIQLKREDVMAAEKKEKSSNKAVAESFNEHLNESLSDYRGMTFKQNAIGEDMELYISDDNMIELIDPAGNRGEGRSIYQFYGIPSMGDTIDQDGKSVDEDDLKPDEIYLSYTSDKALEFFRNNRVEHTFYMDDAVNVDDLSMNFTHMKGINETMTNKGFNFMPGKNHDQIIADLKASGKKYPSGMGAKFGNKWILHIDIADVWQKYTEEDLDLDDPDVFQQFKDEIIPILRKYGEYLSEILDDQYEVGQFQDKVEDLDMQDDVEGWDYSWQELYDWCDYNKVWINIM